ncbi:response regulator [Oleiharenicola lentus]|uniref:response regulator n=1 Tax=Oleiharenicola lentus TaxID=2508720 RepID=UPI003F675F73
MSNPLVITVYIAEDHVSVREMLVAHLKLRANYDVVGQAANGVQVLAECKQLRPRVLILDISLPGMNGLEVARLMRQEAPEVQVLIFSSRYDVATVRQVIELGARGMVAKVAMFTTLIEAIDSVAAGRPFFSSEVMQVFQSSFSIKAERPPLDLTERESEIMRLVAEGRSNKEVSQLLGISVRTAENHRHNIMQKLHAHNAADLTRQAYRMGLLRTDNLAPGS